MIRASILGATGYAGEELVRLLLQHPGVSISHLTTQQYAGRKYAEVFPGFWGQDLPVLENGNPQQIIADSDVIFLALPHGHAFEVAKMAKEQGTKVIDLGADFRLKDATVYEKWYGLKHLAPELLPQAVYGLPEINREEIRKTWLIANPGCYPTASTLALLPLVEKDLVELDSIIIDAKSGISGAGRGAKTDNLYGELNESVKAYGVCCHRHTPEIEQNFSTAAGKQLMLQFTPHLMPMTRGILSTVYANLKRDISEAEIRAVYEERYQKEYFIKILAPGLWPATKMVYSSNNCFINFAIDPRTKRVVASAAIDNLIKGAAGQAIQNFNLMFGFEEIEGIAQLPCWP